MSVCEQILNTNHDDKLERLETLAIKSGNLIKLERNAEEVLLEIDSIGEINDHSILLIIANVRLEVLIKA